MKKILFLTNIPAPYRVLFFNEMCRFYDVTVLYAESPADHKDRNSDWYLNESNLFHAVELQKRISLPGGEWLCTEVFSWLKKPFHQIIICGYHTPTFMMAEMYLRIKKIPFYLEIDGGILAEESAPKRLLKKTLISSASGWVSTGKETNQFFMHYGAKESGIVFSPFSSLKQSDILPDVVSDTERCSLRQELGITEKNVVLAVGQFIPRKGFDILLRSASKLLPDTGIYFVGAEPTEEYETLAKDSGNTAIHFVGFRKPEQLAKYYCASDVFVLPTREDIWGLVINEAMAYGLPVITTNRCVAGIELIENGVNGYIVPVEDTEILAEKINLVLKSDRAIMGRASLERIRPYTIEAMALAHKNAFESERS